jgi:RNase adaptor protein for sRNA GlmZ degradation
MKPIMLIHDFYENDYGVDIVEMEDNISTENILSLLPTTINGYPIEKTRKLNIFTWGMKKSSGVKCDLTFDLTKFRSQVNIDSNDERSDIDIRNLNGNSDEIQTSIIKHPRFLDLTTKIISMIENENAKTVGFYCNYGKHRSVGWAELIKKYYYENAKTKHLNL